MTLERLLVLVVGAALVGFLAYFIQHTRTGQGHAGGGAGPHRRADGRDPGVPHLRRDVRHRQHAGLRRPAPWWARYSWSRLTWGGRSS
ncbi:MAG: hypothetical protein MZV49_06930 [Rhodopseudomonas palustris]|nr:hypothetical protein [Rhodopseudomonas palustris]